MGHVRRARRRTETILNRKTLPATLALTRRIDAIHEQVSSANRLMPDPTLARAATQLANLSREATRNEDGGVVNNGTITGSLTSVYRQLTRILLENGTGTSQSAAEEQKEELTKFLAQASERGWYRPDQEKPVAAPEVEDGFDQSIDLIRKVAAGPDRLLPRDENFGLVRAPLLLLRRAPKLVMYAWTQDPANYKVYIVFGHYALLLDVLFVGIASTLLWIGTPSNVEIDTAKFDDIIGFMARGAKIPRDGLIMTPRPIGGHHYCPILNVGAETRRYFVDWDMPRN